MDVRDLSVWIKEARLRILRRRAERMNSAAVPLMEPSAIKSDMDAVRFEIYGIENEDEIAEAEREYEERKAKGELRPKKWRGNKGVTNA